MGGKLYDFASGLIGPVTDLIGKFVPDEDKARELAYQVSRMAEDNAQARVLAQLAINKAEAESQSLFKGGWRPAAGWTCVVGLFSNVIAYPFLSPFYEYLLEVPMPLIDMTVLLTILGGLLGLGTIRMKEKLQGVAST
jgi:hypothetical protein